MTSEADQQKHPIERLGAIASRVRSIRDLIQVSGRFVFERDLTHPMSVNLGERPVACEMAGNTVRVWVGYTFRANRSMGDATVAAGSTSEQPLIDIEATFLITYEFSDGEKLSDEELRVFGEVNGNLNATAYWREFLNNCLGRAGLPPFVVPPFNAVARINQIKKRVKKQIGASPN